MRPCWARDELQALLMGTTVALGDSFGDSHERQLAHFPFHRSHVRACRAGLLLRYSRKPLTRDNNWRFEVKMVKSLLLGSAAGLVAVSAVQAADLPVKAKPVEHVKVCSLYGAGFYYIIVQKAVIAI